MTTTLNTSRSENTMVLSARVSACMYLLVLDYKREIDTQTPDLGINFPFVI